MKFVPLWLFLFLKMRSKVHVTGMIVGGCALVLFTGMVFFKPQGETTRCTGEGEPVYSKPLYLRTIEKPGRVSKKTVVLQETLKYQRDKLSKELNLLKQKIGRMDCEVSIN